MECEISEVRRSLCETAGEGRTKRCCIINNLSRGTLSSYKRKCTRGVFLPGLIRRGFDSPQPNPYKQALSVMAISVHLVRLNSGFSGSQTNTYFIYCAAVNEGPH